MLEDAANDLVVSHASIWELLNKAGRGHLQVAGTSLSGVLARVLELTVTLLPIELDNIIKGNAIGVAQCAFRDDGNETISIYQATHGLYTVDALSSPQSKALLPAKRLPSSPTAKCVGQGNAPSPQNYQAAGATVAFDLTSNDFLQNVVGLRQNIANLWQFRPGGDFDAQKYNGGPDGGSVTAYGNYSFGEYMGSAGYSLAQTMDGATLAAKTPPGKYSGQRSDFFANGKDGLPARSVQPIVAGYNARRSGNTSCPAHY